MIDSKTLTYEPFHDPRKDEDPEFEGGDSGALLLATDKSGKKYVVKHNDMMDAANEYICCWLAEKMGILAPKAHLLTPNEKFNKPYAVALEYMELSPLSAGEYDYYEMAPIQMLHKLISGNDGIEVLGHNGHICNIDFADSFTISGFEAFCLLTNVPLDQSDPIAYYLMKTYCAYLEFTEEEEKMDLTDKAEMYNLDPEKFNRIAASAARKLIDISDEELSSICSELNNIYSTAIADYYYNCLEYLRDAVAQSEWFNR